MTVQELKQDLEEQERRQKGRKGTGDLELEMRMNKVQRTDEDEKLSKFLRYVRESEEKRGEQQGLGSRLKKNLKLDEEALKEEEASEKQVRTTKAGSSSSQIRKNAAKASVCEGKALLKSPKSARNGTMHVAPKSTSHK